MNTIKAPCKLILEQKGSGKKKGKKKKERENKTENKSKKVLSGDPSIYITDFLT